MRWWFQSLSRDSVCLDADFVAGTSGFRIVSIPESGFCLFGREFAHCLEEERRWFQSLSRDSVCLDMVI